VSSFSDIVPGEVFVKQDIIFGPHWEEEEDVEVDLVGKLPFEEAEGLLDMAEGEPDDVGSFYG
jgi:hypothetical protein